jgi:hypothetical protein
MKGRRGDRRDKLVKLFYSYSHRDEKLRVQLETHLSLLTRERVIAGWNDRQIGAGTDWKGEISTHLKEAEVILLLVSQYFMASDYCYDVEMKSALAREAAGSARVIPVLLRPVDWESAPFAKLQVLPMNGRPITKWSNRDDAFVEVARGIRRVVEELTGKSSPR